jgi:hypothetical protein
MANQSKLAGSYQVIAYEIYYPDKPEEKYVGSTKYRLLSMRMSKHRADAKKGSNCKLHELMRLKGINNFIYKPLATCMVGNFTEQTIFEQHWIDQMKPTLNSQRAHGRDVERYKEYQKEYQQKPEVKQKKKEYQQTTEVKQYQKEYHSRKIECTCCEKSITRGRIEYHNNTTKHIFNFIHY